VKNEGAIRQKIKQITTRHLHKILDRNLRERPENCQFNETRKGEGTLGVQVCGYRDTPYGQLCDRRFGGVEVAKTCGYFSSHLSKQEMKDRFQHWLTTASMGEIAAKFPDIAALMWMLDDPNGQRNIELEIPEEESVDRPAVASATTEDMMVSSEVELEQAQQTVVEQATQIDQLNRTLGQKDRIIEQLKNSDGNEGRFLFRGDPKKHG